MRLIKSLLLFVACLMLNSCSNYTLYNPVLLTVKNGDHSIVDRPDILTIEHRDAMIEILKEYSEPYKLIDGKLYIESKLAKDRDLLANYSLKAEGLRVEKEARKK